MSNILEFIVHILFLIGIIITIIGWFFDRARQFNWLISRIAPDYISGKEALTDLKKDVKIALTTHHKGFHVLINKWPNLISKESVQFIGRSPAFVSFGAEVSNVIQLIAYDREKHEIKERWKMSEANVVIDNILDENLFFVGSLIFWIGIGVSIVSYVISARVAN